MNDFGGKINKMNGVAKNNITGLTNSSEHRLDNQPFMMQSRDASTGFNSVNIQNNLVE